MSPEFRRLAALAATSLRLRVDYLPRSSELLCSVARSGIERRELDLHLSLVPDDAPEVANRLLSAWSEAYLFGYPDTHSETAERVLKGAGGIF